MRSEISPTGRLRSEIVTEQSPAVHEAFSDERAKGEAGAKSKTSHLNNAASALWTASLETQSYLHEVKRWGQSLDGLPNFDGTVFYPFAGGDVLNALAVFPKASSIILAARTPVGDCKVSNWGHAGTRLRASAVRNVLHEFESWGYLLSTRMNSAFGREGQKWNRVGITPLIMAGLHNMGQELLSIDCGTSAASYADVPPGQALRIEFRSRSSPTIIRRLMYVQLDLLKPSQYLNSFLGVVRASAPLATMIKSAVYRIKRDVFRKPGSPIANLILKHSDVVLQDDTGFRLACLSQWSTTLYGRYVGPADETTWGTGKANWAIDYDDSLHAAMCNQATQPMAVHWGYSRRFRVPVCPTVAISTCSKSAKPPDGVQEFTQADNNAGSVAIVAWKRQPDSGSHAEIN